MIHLGNSVTDELLSKMEDWSPVVLGHYFLYGHKTNSVMFQNNYFDE